MNGENKCPNCGEINNFGAKFCRSCGVKLEETNFCPNCGTKNEPGSKFCSNCGASLSLNTPTMNQNYVNPEMTNTHSAATIIGYIFAILGGWIGLILGIYLITRENPTAKKNGKIIIILSIVMAILWIVIGTLIGLATYSSYNSYNGYSGYYY